MSSICKWVLGTFFLCWRPANTSRRVNDCPFVRQGSTRALLCAVSFFQSMVPSWTRDFLGTSRSQLLFTPQTTKYVGIEDGVTGRAMGLSRCDGSDLPALQPSQEFASSLVERLGRRDRLCANSPWCSCDAGWQRQLAPVLGQVPAKRKAGKGEPRSQAVEPKSEVPILGVEPVPPTLSACP